MVCFITKSCMQSKFPRVADGIEGLFCLTNVVGEELKLMLNVKGLKVYITAHQRKDINVPLV